MTRTGTIAWSVLGIVSAAFLLFCGGWIAIVGFAFSIDAPHAWKGDVRDGLLFWLIAIALIVPAIFLFTGSIRRLRSLRQPRFNHASKEQR
jgi:uncharacterized membrane protein YedE/YeeE